MTDELEEIDFLAEARRLYKQQRDSGMADEPEDTDRQRAAVLRCIGVPARVRRQLPPTRQTEALDTVQRWCSTEGLWGLVLAGPVGVGKTVAAGWWLSEVSQGLDASPVLTNRWWPATEIAALDYYGEDFQKLLRVPTLVLDDQGPEFADRAGMLSSKMDRLIDARYREELRTLVTTNLNAKQFAQRYDERIASRFREDAWFCELRGDDLRRSM